MIHRSTVTVLATRFAITEIPCFTTGPAMVASQNSLATMVRFRDVFA